MVSVGFNLVNEEVVRSTQYGAMPVGMYSLSLCEVGMRRT